MPVTDLPFGASTKDDAFVETWASTRQRFGWAGAVNNGPIGRRFLLTGFVFFLIGGIQALVMRLQLAQPEQDLISPELYNQLMTMHGSTMMFLFVVPILEGVATLISPGMLGTRDLPFPRLTSFAYWAYLFGGILMYGSFFVGAVPDGGWFAYVPLTGPEFSPGLAMDFWLLGLELAEAAGIISAFELIIAILAMRAPGMTLGRLPIFLWAMLTVSAMILFAFMTVLIASLFLELDRKVGTAFFDPELGGSPLLWQHLFWFFGHPEVYIQFLPAAGIISMIVPVFSRRPLASYTAVVLALVATGALSYGLWAHHMFTVGLPDMTVAYFSTMSTVVAIPTGIQFFVWIATIWRGNVVWKTPMLFAVGFFFIFLIGGLTGVMVGVAPFDWQVHDSYFVVAHFHYVLIGGVVFPLVAGFYYWMPKITGKLLDERLGRWNFWLMFIGFNVGFFPMHLSGFLGMPRRVYTYLGGAGLDVYNLVSTIGAFVFATGVLLFVLNFLLSLRTPDVGPNPWGADTLEWATASPVPPYGFRHLPIVHDRSPLWSQDRLDEGDPETVDMVETLAEWPVAWQGAVVTDVFTGRIREVFWLPNISFMPVTLALGLAIVFGALIFDAYGIAAVGGLIAAAAYVRWMIPHRPDTRHDPAIEERFRRFGVSVYLHSSPTVARWSLLLTLTIVAVTFATFEYSYFYLATNASGAWPPEGMTPTGTVASWIAAGLLAVSLVPAAWAHRANAAVSDAAQVPRGRVLAGLMVAMVLGLAAIVVQLWAYAGLGFGATGHAYGSVFYLLAAFQVFVLVTGLTMNVIAQVRLLLNVDPDEVARVRVSSGNAALTWYVAVALALGVFVTLYLSSGAM